MLERETIQARGFHNMIRDGRTVGFQFCVRLDYYRGIFLSQLRPQSVVVDGISYPKESVVWELKGQEYGFEEMKSLGNVHWSPTETATLKIYREGGLTPGYHEITARYRYSSSYIPPKLQEGIDSEEGSPLLNALFGVGRSTRKLLLVW